MKAKEKSVIVIGGGLGGLSAAISLASEGFRVSLFEKNKHLGGKLNIREIDGFSFDLGPSILILPHIFEALFKRAGKCMKDYVPLEELSTHWRNFFEDGVQVDLCADFKDTERELAKLGPKAAKGFYSYIDYSRNLWNYVEEHYFAKRSDTVWDIMRGDNLFNIPAKSDCLSSMAQGVHRHIKDPYLRRIMNFFIKYVGSSAYDAPGMYNLLAYSQYGYGLWYVTGGMFNLSKGLEKLMRELQIDIHLDAEVTAVQSQGQKISSITLGDGSQHSADIIVSNMEVIPAYKKLFNEQPSLLNKYEKTFTPSCSGLVVHLGVNRTYPQLAHHNFFFARDEKKHFNTVYRKKELPDDPTIYLVAPTRTDDTIAPQGHEIIKILPHIPHLTDKEVAPEDYLALKEKLYDKLERMGLENLRKHIVVEDMLTPVDIEQMYFSNKGSIYGIEAHRTRNLGCRAPKKCRQFENLYFVGGSVNPGSGMPMVVLSGQMVRDMILEDYKT
ncbi:MAG: phytoene desaturase family protein [Verrucomicrobiota bacterium]